MIESIALIETALAHILNAEGEKIQKAVAVSKDIDELLEINRSVNKTIINVCQLEQTLYQKLDTASALYEDEQSDPPECHCPHPNKKSRKCYYISDATYKCKTQLPLSKTEQCSGCVPVILKGGNYSIAFHLMFDRIKGSFDYVDIEFLFCNKEKIIKSIRFSEYVSKSCGSMKGELTIELPNSFNEYVFSIMLMSPCCANVTGEVSITEWD